MRKLFMTFGGVSRALCGGALLALAGCSGGEGAEKQPAATDDAYFDETRRIEISVEMAPADWEILREQGRDITDLFDPDAAFEYAYFDASVTVDGQRYDQVQVRKKGFLGSLSALRPSLKIDLDRTVEGQSHAGLRSLTLNNDRQDPSHTHQCMAYRLFEQAGVPASRCNLAHVVVNGEDLGSYSNVEGISKQFLARHFADNDGNLYEGQATDLDPESIARLQLKTNETENDRSDVAALAEALTASDDELVSELSAQLELDAFHDFWAVETLAGHWDGYSGNSNNYFLYRDPTTQRFFFLPWGTDAAFEGVNPFDPLNQDVTVFAAGLIANRLYKLPDQRERHRERLAELNDSLWRESELLAQVDRVAALAPDASESALADQRAHVQAHGGIVRAALAEPAKEWNDTSGLLVSSCLGMRSSVSGSFDTHFGDLQSARPGGELTIELDGTPVQLSWLGAAGIDATQDQNPRIRYLAPLEGGTFLIVDFAVPASRFSPGKKLFHGLETTGTVFTISASGFSLIGLIGEGGIELTQAAATNGAPVAGTLSGQLVQFSCAEL